MENLVGINNVDTHATTSSLAMTSFGIPLTSTSMSSAGFTIGFIKG
jgi:hypothetical protein